MVVGSCQNGGRSLWAELTPGAPVAVNVDQPGQQRVLPGPTSWGLCLSPLLRKAGSPTGKNDSVAVEDHGTVVDDGERCDEATGQQDARFVPHVRMMDSVEMSGGVGVDFGGL